MLGTRVPRSRIRLDFLHVKDNLLAKGGQDIESNADLAALATNLCAVSTWEYGEAQSKNICQPSYMHVKVTGMIGLPADSLKRRKFDTYKRTVDPIEQSRFVTFEMAIIMPTDEKIDI
mmetsp:Transcript_20895/g.25663  ORF Transcript_20895/g.25663 Transcript_20895/m.25663 type:complete len:118 (+) Transcript_20895:2830-3183(+)|eukprot:CAMPEP_0170463558 /NCGR_PEP_ID=MMETSP0123-20130129/8630_1 /TAXON_ID=182087 /ORGANISM="Favella ehrenbergii, Strain Fehren 1" /LENGTH=117 /DNA_ID=CAMNT_0010729031 /DNA_START=2770 /DNA_END=3123 /DNA_ORIENTATION=-